MILSEYNRKKAALQIGGGLLVPIILLDYYLL